MAFVVRYVAGTDLALRFPSVRYPWRGPGFATREHAEKVRQACPNAEAMEVIETSEVAS